MSNNVVKVTGDEWAHIIYVLRETARKNINVKLMFDDPCISIV